MQYLANKENKNLEKNENIIEKKSFLQKELNTKEIIMGLGIASAIFAYGFVSIYPKYTQLQSAKTELEGINTNIELYEAKLSTMPELEDKLQNLEREMKVKSRMLSHNMEDGMFLIGLSKMMDGVYVDLVDYTMEEAIPYESFYAIPTTITVRGDYKHVREVMYYLEEQKNMTQILDYNMKTYMEEETSETSSNSVANTTTKLVPDSHVHWTEAGAAYHKAECEVLAGDKSVEGAVAKEGDPATSGKNTACQVCKPYSEQQVTEQVQTQTQTTTKPKAKGDIEATFKFMMYSSDNPVLELEKDNPNNWKPGKYNPFKTTSR